MKILSHDEMTQFRVRLDDETVARLIAIADACHAQPAELIAAIVHDVLEDDALAHMEGPEPLH